VSICPECHQEAGGAFCARCYRSLEDAPPGRFTPLLEPSVNESRLPAQIAGPDLLTLAPPIRTRHASPARGLWLLCLLLCLCAAGVGFLRHNLYQQAVQHRRSGIALTRQGDFEGARAQLALAPDEPETYRARAELAVALGQWQTAADLYRMISVSNAEVNSRLDEAAHERALALLTEARGAKDTVRALSLSDQAEELLVKHHGRPEHQAAVHLLRATLFEKLELRVEAIRELRAALTLNPGLGTARQLLAEWTPPPALPPTERPAPVKPLPRSQRPRLQTHPDYPTYQPPQRDLQTPAPEVPVTGPSSKTRPRR
jgi:tetratricopeptide (TPR) repeat protein